MKRRSFIQQSAQVSLALPLLGVMSCEAEHKPKYKMGLQLFTVRDAMEKDPIATLKALKAMGYEDFESYGYDAKNKLYYGFSPKEFKTVLDDLSLSTSSGHYGVNGLMEVSEDELNASKPSEINPECWQIANPNFDPHAQSDAWKEKNL